MTQRALGTVGSAPLAAILVAGGIAVGLAAVVAVSIVLGTALVCGGSDAGAPSESELCESGTARVLAYAGGAALVAAPLIGTAAAVARASWTPLVIACAAAVTGLAVFLLVV
jgi:hypothetical protein